MPRKAFLASRDRMSHRRGSNYQAFGLQILCEGHGIAAFDSKTTGTSLIQVPKSQHSSFGQKSQRNIDNNK